MKRLLYYFTLNITILMSVTLAQTINKDIFTATGFKEKAFNHVEKLSCIGIRSAGSSEEKQTALYIKDQFEEAGLSTTSEPFEFESFEISDIQFSMSGKKIDPLLVGFDPYQSQKHFTGSAILYNPDRSISPEQVREKTVITKSPANYFMLMGFGAKAVVYIDSTEFTPVKDFETIDFNLYIFGETNKMTSSNIVGMLNAPVQTEKDILITAHYDSYRTSPGANDNGTGIGTLIELAHIFKQQPEKLTCNIRFVAFGSEEVGLLGSRMYLKNHSADLENCKLVFNLDTVGGKGDICAETLGGVSEKKSSGIKNTIPEYLMNKSWEDPNGQWRIMSAEILPPLTISNVPDWLKQMIIDSAHEHEIPVHESKGLFSDMRTFAQAGIPSTGVAQKTGSPIFHTPNDTPEKINKNQMEQAGKICHSVIMKTMRPENDPNLKTD